MKLQAGAERRLNAYLDEVTAALRASGEDEAGVETVRESLREQVLEIAGRGAEEVIDSEGIGAAIATLDTPEAYGATPRDDAAAIAAAPKVPLSGLAKLSAGLSVVGALFVIATGFMGLEGKQQDAAGGAFVIAELIALAAGMITWRESWGRFGAISALLLLSLLIVMVLGSFASA